MIHLPTEIWLQICKHLTAADLICFCEAYSEYKHLLRDKYIVKYFDIQSSHLFTQVDLFKYLTENVAYYCIRTLNINQLYWVSLITLRKILIKLPKLEELYALGTTIGLREKDVKLYGSLRTLAVSVDANECNVPTYVVKNNMYLLKKFCLQIVSRKSHTVSLYQIFGELFGLRELWIEDADDKPYDQFAFDSVIYKLQFLNKLVIKSRQNIPFLDYKFLGLAKVYETRRFKSIVACYVRYPQDKIIPLKHVSLFEPLETKIEEGWEIIRRFHCEMPYDVKAAEQIYITRNIRDVSFKELNFCHNICFCNKSFISAIWNFLSAPNSKHLKKLCLKSCALQRQEVLKSHDASALEKNYPFKDAVENCSSLTDLELMSCPSCNVTIVDAYFLVSNFKYLEKLTVEVPIFVNGRFLIRVIDNCKHLKYLRVLSCGTNELLNRYLFQALPLAYALEDFSIESEQLNIRDLLESLNKIPNCKLLKLYIKCKYDNSNIYQALHNFLRDNVQLMYLMLNIDMHGKPMKNVVQDAMNAYRKSYPYKKYNIRKCTDTHYDTNVSTINFYDFK